MLYQLAKTSVGLTGQVKWNLILNNNKVTDFQLTPIHESINFNYTKREDTLNYTHVQNLNRLYKKIPYSFFQTVVRPELNTGYPVRNTGTRIDTHENTYEMGMKRISYKRYGKQFAFFCPVWCDNKEDLMNIRFKIVLKNNKDTMISTREIDYSMIKPYLSQFADEFDLNSNLIYLNFKNYDSWIKGICVKDGTVRTKDVLNVIDNLKSQERTMLETDNALLSQFSNNNMVCGQLFNFNFVFDVNDIILPQMMSDFLGDVINVYIDVYNKNIQVPVKDIYSNYDFIPKYDIKNGKYIHKNCLDYLKDYTNIESITKNKLVQTTFHWSLMENPDYLFNLYDGCAPMYEDREVRGQYFNIPDLTSETWNPSKNQISWCNPLTLHQGDKGLTEFDIENEILNLFNHPENEHWYHIEKKSDIENYWIDGVLYENKIKWAKNTTDALSPVITGKDGDTMLLSASLCKNLYFNVTFIPDNTCTSISSFDRSLNVDFEDISERQDGKGEFQDRIFFKHYAAAVKNDNISDSEINNMIYVLLGKSDHNLSYFNMISFVVFMRKNNIKENTYLYEGEGNHAYYFINRLITKKLIDKWPWKYRSIPKGETIKVNDFENARPDTLNISDYNPLSLLTSVSVLNDEESGRYYTQLDGYWPGALHGSAPSVPYYQNGVETYPSVQWELMDLNTKLIWNLRSIVRTMSENLQNIVLPSTNIFQKSIIYSSTNYPEVLGNYNSNVLKETDYYNTDKFSYVFRYDGKLYPYFIDPLYKSEKKSLKNLVYNNVYITKQYNQQINALEWSDADMENFNTYVSTKFSPLYPSLDYFSLRKKKCYIDQFYRESRRYLGEKSWFKANMLYMLPQSIHLSCTGSSLSDKTIKNMLKNKLNEILRYQVKGGELQTKKDLIFDHFIYPLYDCTYTFDYIDNKTIDKYKYDIKYTLK